MAMFNFLKKRLKKFEDELESELEEEVLKEESQQNVEETQEVVEEKPQQEPIKEAEEPVVSKESQEAEMVPEPKAEPEILDEKPVEKKPEPKPEPKEVSEPSVEDLSPRQRRRQKKMSEEKKKREQERDRQIEESIERELERVVQTRKSIESSVSDKKRDSSRTASIDEQKLNDLLWDLEMGLLESDVAYSVIDSIKNDIREELSQIPLSKIRSGDFVQDVLKNAINHVLQTSKFDFDEFLQSTKKPLVIMFVGVNGTGKTLSIGKMAYYLKQKNMTCVMAAGDTFRAGAIDQLNVHADNLGVKIIKHGPGADPAAVAYDAIEHAKAKHKDVVLLDTAGRMQTNYNLMDEMAKIKRVAKPDLIVFVGDALAGNDAVEQAKRFNEVVGIDGVILTKVDTDAKGGSSLSIAYTIGKPLLFIGLGQEYPDQIVFDAQWMIENIFEEEQ